MDIKIGNGAFMKNKQDALELGEYLKKKKTQKDF